MKDMTKKALQRSGLSQDPKEAKKAMEQNNQLKKLLGEKELEIEILRDLLKKRGFHCHQDRDSCQMDQHRL